MGKTDLERETIEQSFNNKWHNEHKYRITSSNAHKVYIRTKNFSTLAESFINPDKKKLPKFVLEAMKHWQKYESVARQKYFDYLKYTLNHKIFIRETGIVVQPNLF